MSEEQEKQIMEKLARWIDLEHRIVCNFLAWLITPVYRCNGQQLTEDNLLCMVRSHIEKCVEKQALILMLRKSRSLHSSLQVYFSQTHIEGSQCFSPVSCDKPQHLPNIHHHRHFCDVFEPSFNSKSSRNP